MIKERYDLKVEVAQQDLFGQCSGRFGSHSQGAHPEAMARRRWDDRSGGDLGWGEWA